MVSFILNITKERLVSVRIFSCGNNLENLNICMNENVIGFRHLFSEDIQNDTIYIVIKKDGISHCCARATISFVTDYIPWEQPEIYVLCHRIKNIEYCTPFSLDFLKDTSAGKLWGLSYIQGSKIIKDKNALKMLKEHFQANQSENFYQFTEEEISPPKKKRGRKPKTTIIESETSDDVMGADESGKFDIMGTFKTVKFKNETDVFKGLETLVNENFYKLFVVFQEQNSILISKNRLFPTVGKDDTNGIIGVPDAVLLSFDQDDRKSNIKINIIEYECYGESKIKSTEKFNYMNSHIIPQLIRFASTFSVVTDSSIREETVKNWIEKIVNYIDNDSGLEIKMHNWLRQLNPKIKDSHLIDEFKNQLEESFNNNIRIMLIIDELTGEQNETIKNVIHSFKLTGNSKNFISYIDFSGYVVRLEHMLNYDNSATSKYALSIQDN